MRNAKSFQEVSGSICLGYPGLIWYYFVTLTKTRNLCGSLTGKCANVTMSYNQEMKEIGMKIYEKLKDFASLISLKIAAFSNIFDPCTQHCLLTGDRILHQFVSLCPFKPPTIRVAKEGSTLGCSAQKCKIPIH